MQTLFLVWLPGLGAFALGLSVAYFIAAKAWNLVVQARAIQASDRLVIENGRTLKEICGSSNFDMLPPDLQERVRGQVADTQIAVRRQL